MTSTQDIPCFWRQFKSLTDTEAEYSDAFGLGDSPVLNQRLLELVLEGKKRACTTLVREMELQGWPEPKVIVRFWIIAIALALLAMSTLKLR